MSSIATPLAERTNSSPVTGATEDMLGRRHTVLKSREEGQEHEAVAFLLAASMQQQQQAERTAASSEDDTSSVKTVAASSEDDASENAGEEGAALLLAFQFQQDVPPRAAELEEPPPVAPPRRRDDAAQKRRGVADRASRFACNFPGCGNAYGCPDAVRKHCRKKHGEWLRSLGPVGPAGYCSWTSDM